MIINMKADKSTVLPDMRRDIVSGALPSGSRLRIDELAARYGVSAMPVRGALNHLHGEGLVVIEHNRGARVRQVDARFVGNLFDIRAALEVMLAQRGAERRADADVFALEEEQRAFESFVAASDWAAVLSSNRRFHQIINVAADNDEALSLADRHWTLIATLWQRYGYREERFVGVINDHRQLILAVKARDGAAAAAIMNAHVVKSKLELLQLLRETAR
jgi:DNA-binding GntR family transcriptional regulator